MNVQTVLVCGHIYVDILVINHCPPIDIIAFSQYIDILPSHRGSYIKYLRDYTWPDPQNLITDSNTI